MAKIETTEEDIKDSTREVLRGCPVDADMSGIEAELARIAHSLKSYNVNACDGEMSFGVRLVLEGDAVESIADSLKRIADAVGKTH